MDNVPITARLRFTPDGPQIELLVAPADLERIQVQVASGRALEAPGRRFRVLNMVLRGEALHWILKEEPHG